MLSLICLIAAIFVLQSKQDMCCQGLQQWLATSPIARAPLQLPNTPPVLTTTENTGDKNTAEGYALGYVFSLAVKPSSLKSALPDKALEETKDSSNTANNATLPANTTIINSAQDLRILPNQQETSKQHSSLIRNLLNRQNSLTVLILFVASFLQGASGFSFSMLMIPLLIWNGFSLAEASIFTAISAFAIISIRVFRLRTHVKWTVLWPTLFLSTLFLPTMFLRIAGLVIGIFFLTILTTVNSVLLLQILSVLVLTIIVPQILRQTIATGEAQPTPKPKAYWAWLASASAGLLNGLVGFGGQVWTVQKKWSSEENHAFKTVSYSILLALQIILLSSTFGKALLPTTIQAVYFLPITFIAMFLGIWLDKLGRRGLDRQELANQDSQWDKTQVHYLIQILLVAIALFSLLVTTVSLG